MKAIKAVSPKVTAEEINKMDIQVRTIEGVNPLYELTAITPTSLSFFGRNENPWVLGRKTTIVVTNIAKSAGLKVGFLHNDCVSHAEGK